MKCESCNIHEVEVEEPSDEGQKPYRLCFSCRERLLNVALRPLEFFNLTAIHGHSSYLHDDFYDCDTGKATQPKIVVADIDRFPYPDFERIKNNLDRLIDYSFVQYFTDDRVILELQKFDQRETLNRLEAKVTYNRAINYKAYEIAAKVIGSVAEEWIRDEWTNRHDNELLVFAEAIASCLDFKEGFHIVTTEIEKSDDRTFNTNVLALLHFKDEKALDWIESIRHRIKNVSSSWGTLAAGSKFSWNRASKWLDTGRPLSLVALDALVFCTSNSKSNRTLWLSKSPPVLLDSPKPEVVAKRLSAYLIIDNVPRTKDAVATIISNVYEMK